MKATKTQFKKWGFLKQIKKFHIALGVIALGGLTTMLFFQNCADSGNIAGLSPSYPEPIKNGFNMCYQDGLAFYSLKVDKRFKPF